MRTNRGWCGVLNRRAGMAAGLLVGMAGVGPLAWGQPTDPDGIAGGGERPFAGHQVVRVDVRSQRELLAVTSLVENVWSCRWGVGPMDVQVTDEQIKALEGLGLSWREIVPDVQALVDREAAEIAAAAVALTPDWFMTFRNLDAINAKIDADVAGSGGLMSVGTVGTSVEGRGIRWVSISGPDLPGNPRSSRPQVVINGGQHAREWVSPMTVMYIVDRLRSGYGSDPRITDVLQRVEVIAVPVVNPDGYVWTWANQSNRLWRKNRRNNGNGTFGVDLNRNWSFEWGGTGSSGATNNDTYRGPSPLSEPESTALAAYLDGLPRLTAHVDYHSFSQLILSPWGYSDTPPPTPAVFNTVTPIIEAGIESVFGAPYVGGGSASTLYAAAGNMVDWVYGTQGAMSWTIELRDTGFSGFVLPSSQIVPTGRENLEGFLRLAEWVGGALTMRVERGAEVMAPGVGAEVEFVVGPGVSGVGTTPPRVMARLTGGDGAGVFVPISATAVSAGRWRATLPAAGCGERVEYYVEAFATGEASVRLPSAAPAVVFEGRAMERRVAWADDAETDRGWSLSSPGDTATAGRWERGVPQQTRQSATSPIAQPGQDASAVGTQCFMTGLAAGTGVGSFDLDNGTTTLTSPVLSARPPRGFAADRTRVEYARWYFANEATSPASDTLLVQVSFDGGATWALADEVSEATSAWEAASIVLEDVGTPTDATRVRFVARDAGTQGIVEVGIDDVALVVMGCPRSADINGSGGVPDIDDLVAFFEAFNAGDALADFDGSGGVPDVDDILEFFAAFNG